MTLTNSSHEYGAVAKWLHWLIGLSIIGMIVMGFYLHSFAPTHRYLIIQLHMSTGITLLMLMIVRLIWRQINVTPAAPLQMPRWQQRLANGTHVLLYLIAIILPLSGWLMTASAGYATHWFFLFTLHMPFIAKNPKAAQYYWQVHSLTAWLISAVTVAHTLAALKHHFIDRDNVLLRMLPRRRRR